MPLRHLGSQLVWGTYGVKPSALPVACAYCPRPWTPFTVGTGNRGGLASLGSVATTGAAAKQHSAAAIAAFITRPLSTCRGHDLTDYPL